MTRALLVWAVSASLAIAQANVSSQETRVQSAFSKKDHILTRLAEVTALTRANQLKHEVAELEVKLEVVLELLGHI